MEIKTCEYTTGDTLAEGGLHRYITLASGDWMARTPISYYGWSGILIDRDELTASDRSAFYRLFKESVPIVEAAEREEPLVVVHGVPESVQSERERHFIFGGPQYYIFREPFRGNVERKIITAYGDFSRAHRLSKFVRERLDGVGLVKILSDEDAALVEMIVEKDKVHIPTPEGTVAVFELGDEDPRRLVLCKPEYSDQLKALYRQVSERFGETVEVAEL